MITKGTNLKNEKDLSEYSKFLAKYGGLSFNNVSFRPGVHFTTPFGLDNTFNDLRFHVAIDRGTNPKEIYAPFDLTHIEINVAGTSVWGIQLRLHTNYGFEVRVAHIEDLPDETMNMIKNRAAVKSGTYLCQAGKAGKSTGIHTHTEIVSYEEKASFLEEILFIKYKGKEKIGYTLNDITNYLTKYNLKGSPAEVYARELKKKRISFINGYLCRRRDYFHNRKCTFYSSQALFGF